MMIHVTKLQGGQTKLYNSRINYQMILREIAAPQSKKLISNLYAYQGKNDGYLYGNIRDGSFGVQYKGRDGMVYDVKFAALTPQFARSYLQRL